jgi:hypothetical protein
MQTPVLVKIFLCLGKKICPDSGIEIKPKPNGLRMNPRFAEERRAAVKELVDVMAPKLVPPQPVGSGWKSSVC